MEATLRNSKSLSRQARFLTAREKLQTMALLNQQTRLQALPTLGLTSRPERPDRCAYSPIDWLPLLSGNLNWEWVLSQCPKFLLIYSLQSLQIFVKLNFKTRKMLEIKDHHRFSLASFPSQLELKFDVGHTPLWITLVSLPPSTWFSFSLQLIFEFHSLRSLAFKSSLLAWLKVLSGKRISIIM